MASVRPNVSELLTAGEQARLFPVPAGKAKSQERHTTSIFLACLSLVPNLGRALIEPLGMRIGNRSRIQTFAEVVLDDSSDGQSNRPDGLIAVSRGKETWTALVEAKVQRSKLDRAQIEAYLHLARDKSIDALITVSNDFAAIPGHHPLQPIRVPKNVGLFHWSWSSVLTHAKLLKEQGLDTSEQHTVLSEFIRFLEHENFRRDASRQHGAGLEGPCGLRSRRHTTEKDIRSGRRCCWYLASRDPRSRASVVGGRQRQRHHRSFSGAQRQFKQTH